MPVALHHVQPSVSRSRGERGSSDQTPEGGPDIRGHRQGAGGECQHRLEHAQAGGPRV